MSHDQLHSHSALFVYEMVCIRKYVGEGPHECNSSHYTLKYDTMSCVVDLELQLQASIVSTYNGNFL